VQVATPVVACGSSDIATPESLSLMMQPSVPLSTDRGSRAAIGRNIERERF
jgi:hypothetical protein